MFLKKFRSTYSFARTPLCGGENSAYFEESQAELDISIEKPCNKNHNLMTYSLN